MSFEDFKKIYGGLNTASTLCDEYEGTLRGLQSAGALEQMLRDAVNDPNIPLPRLREDSAKTRQAEVALQSREKAKIEILNYTKANIDEILNSYDKKNVIRAAALGIQPINLEDTSELAQYLTAYNLIELLKIEEDTEDKKDRSHKRKRRLTGEQRGALVDRVLPLIVKEILRNSGKLQEKDLDYHSKTIAYLGAFDRGYVAWTINEGQELLGKRIEKIGGVEDYIKTNLKGKDEDEENEKYLLFASNLGEAYKLSEAHKKASESEAH